MCRWRLLKERRDVTTATAELDVGSRVGNVAEGITEGFDVGAAGVEVLVDGVSKAHDDANHVKRHVVGAGLTYACDVLCATGALGRPKRRIG